MIIYLHGFDSSSLGNHEKVMQLKFIDEDVRLISYSTIHPKHDMSYLLNEVNKQLIQCGSDEPVLITGVGLGGYWSERIGFLCGIPAVMFNPNLSPEKTMEGKIERPEEYADIGTKCVTDFRTKNTGNCIVVLSREDELLDSQASEAVLSPFYQVIWDDEQSHKFKDITGHLKMLKVFRRKQLIPKI
jgi:predicted esterase YcpF (UPF0227 family)